MLYSIDTELTERARKDKENNILKIPRDQVRFL